MNQFLLGRVRLLVVCVCSLFVMLLFAACGSVAGTTGSGPATGPGSATITGQVVSVHATTHSVVVNVNGQQYTVSGLSDQEVSQLQGALNKTWSFQVTGGNGSYTVSSGTTPQEQDNATPQQANATPQNNGNQGTGAPAQGSISFIGAVQSVNASSISVKMPNGDIVPMSISTLTDRKDFGVGLPSNGQQVKVDAITNPDGSFTAKSLDVVKPDDQANPTKVNTVDLQGVTTSAVGSNGVINFKVGNKSYSFSISPTTQVKDFVSAQSIGSGQAVKVTVLFNNGSPNVLEVKNGLD
jgi:hypothetical protein